MRQRASSRYEARGKFGEHERCVRVARGVAEDGFVICYWRGSYNKEWRPHTLPARRGSNENQLWTQQLPKTCIKCFGFSLDENSKLLPGTKAVLRKAYKTREENLTGTQ